jgi:hypothetical protein
MVTNVTLKFDTTIDSFKTLIDGPLYEHLICAFVYRRDNPTNSYVSVELLVPANDLAKAQEVIQFLQPRGNKMEKVETITLNNVT